jgi:predicted nucleotidyltransferase component of viral defense system
VLEKFDIRVWVDENPNQQSFRQAVHTILTAISGNPHLQTSMIMKGGILLALGYESTRFTKDIDFSTATTTKDFDGDKFKSQFESVLLNAVEQLDYGLDCRLQSYRQNPPGEDKTFPTIQMTVGFAYKGNANAHKRLMANNSSQIVRIDYSLNEPPGDPELFEIEDGSSIRTYSFHDLVGEKFRALLQQETRRLRRPQDIYDLYFLLNDHPLKDDPTTKWQILRSLKEKAAARNLAAEKESMRNPEIIRRSNADYRDLESQIEGELPNFDEIYAAMEAYYEGLPWET